MKSALQLTSMHINKLEVVNFAIVYALFCVSGALQFIHFGIDIVDRTLELQMPYCFWGKFTFYYHFGCTRHNACMHRSHELSNEHESHAKQLNCQLFDGTTSEKSGHRWSGGEEEHGRREGLEESKIQSKTCTMKIG